MINDKSDVLVGDNIPSKISNWKFAGEVAENFDNHVNKSVPLYQEGHEVILSLADFFLKDGSLVYEIGCSTGTLIKKLSEKNAEIDKHIQLIGMDCEADMIEKAKTKCQGLKNITLLNDDVVTADLKKSDLIISYYTIQFIPPQVRQQVFDKIYESLNWGGAFIMFEKTRACDARFQDIMSTLYIEYKQSQGYSNNEIISKQISLKGMLEPFSTQGNMDMLKRAGFLDTMTVMKYLSFEGFLAIK